MKLAIKLYKLTRNGCHVYIVKMKHIFYVVVHLTLRSRTRGLLLYGRAASVIFENYHSLLSEISKMSKKNTLIYHYQQRPMSMFTLETQKSIINILVLHI